MIEFNLAGEKALRMSQLKINTFLSERQMQKDNQSLRKLGMQARVAKLANA